MRRRREVAKRLLKVAATFEEFPGGVFRDPAQKFEDLHPGDVEQLCGRPHNCYNVAPPFMWRSAPAAACNAVKGVLDAT